MLPAALRHNRANMPRSVCIVGAGPAGLVAAKTLLHNAPAGAFEVSVFESQPSLGGLWPSSPSDAARLVNPLMGANQSRHTMHFSDLAWEEGAAQFPRAWQIGRYLEAYEERYLRSHPGFRLRCGTRVVEARRDVSASFTWHVRVECGGEQETRQFTHLIVASGYFGRPVVPEGISLAPTAPIPVIHSSQYRDLESLLGTAASAKGTILVVGGQMSGVEVAGAIATRLSSATHSPDGSPIKDVAQCSVHHIIPRPVWVVPLHTAADYRLANAAAPPFLPLDFASYNLNNRSQPLVNTHGHIDEQTVQSVHAMFQEALGTDQSIYSSELHVTDQHKLDPPHLAISDWYCEFVRSGLISLSTGRFSTLRGNTAELTDGRTIENIVAVVLATGFDPSPCISYLPADVLQTLNHSPQHHKLPLTLAFHGTYHPEVPNLGFVGFYRSPYWGVMQMQARFLAEYWSSSIGTSGLPEALRRKLDEDDSIQRTLALRDDPRQSQSPMGDFLFLMQEFAEALSIPKVDSSHCKLPLDMLNASRYPSPSDDPNAQQEAEDLRFEAHQMIIHGLTTPRFVPRAVFRSLLGTWKLERDLESRLPTHPSGHFSGTAQFLLREQTADGLQCAEQSAGGLDMSDSGSALEYLYVEDGEFRTKEGFGFRATRRYVWRYDMKKEVLSVWFVKPSEPMRADYLFHEIMFLQPMQDDDGDGGSGWAAKAGHLCIDDYYDVKYRFSFESVNLTDWSIEYLVRGPNKDYNIRGGYRR